jgi:hypothetical protein
MMSLGLPQIRRRSRVSVYRPGSYTFTRDRIGTRYAFVAVRVLVDPNDSNRCAGGACLQDAIQVEQKNPGRLEPPNWVATPSHRRSDQEAQPINLLLCPEHAP